MRKERSLGAQYAQWCVHYRGLQHDTCKLDINYRELTGGDDFGIANRIPCIKENATLVRCTHCHYPTEEEIAAHVAETEEHLQRFSEDNLLISTNHDPTIPQSTVYVCQLCERASRTVTTSNTAFAEHVLEAHGIDHDTLKTAKGRMGAHMDGREWFQNDDMFSLPDGRELLIRSTRTKRRGSDRALWADDDDKAQGKQRKKR